MTIANRFAWSVSREAIFNTCRRRYYAHYYLSWGGWQRGAPAIVRESFKLKRLVSLHLWRGQLVHYVVSKVLQSMQAKGRIPDRQRVMDYACERFHRQLEFSRSRLYLSTPKKRENSLNIDWLALLDHEYGRPIADDLLAEIRSECVRGVEGLYECPLFETLGKTDVGQWIIEDLDRGAFAQQFVFDGIPVYVKTDFLFRDRDGNLCIVDWKTNAGTEPTIDAREAEPKDAAIQLGVYEYYAAHVLHEPIASIRLLEVNLLDHGRVREHAAAEEAYGAAARHIAEGIRRLSSVIVDGDAARNEPLAIEFFPKIANGKCRFCNFFRICKDERYADRLP